MSLVNISARRTIPDVDVERLDHLARTLSWQLTRVAADGVAGTIAESLAQIALITRAAACQLLEFNQFGSVTQANVASGPVAPEHDVAAQPWLVARVSRGEVVSIVRPEELPSDAVKTREHADRAGGCAILAVPSTAAGRVSCALVLDCGPLLRWWPPTLIERLQLLVNIMSRALQRIQMESAVRSSITSIEQLNSQLAADNGLLKEEIKNIHDFDEIVGDSAALQLALARLSQVAPTNSSALLLGPTGTGKELFARALHDRSRRHARPFVRVNCAALPPTLIESELFGHEKGAFTGAVAMRPGRFELADGGTIFLDEIGDLAPEVQVKFLRVLQEGEFERVGSSRTKTVDVRVIAATHCDLEAAVAQGTFRADLYYRLSVYPIRLPSLCERREDIPQLVWFFIHRHQRELGRMITKVPQDVMDTLQHHSWPGNVRELENIVERAMIASNGDTLQLDEPLRRSSGANSITVPSDNLDDLVRSHIESVLKRCGWRINGHDNAAERLGVHPNTLRFRMKKLGVAGPAERARTLGLDHQA